MPRSVSSTSPMAAPAGASQERGSLLCTTQSGEPVANFNLAVDQGYGERKPTAKVRVTVWGKQAEAAAQHLSLAK